MRRRSLARTLVLFLGADHSQKYTFSEIRFFLWVAPQRALRISCAEVELRRERSSVLRSCIRWYLSSYISFRVGVFPPGRSLRSSKTCASPSLSESLFHTCVFCGGAYKRRFRRRRPKFSVWPRPTLTGGPSTQASCMYLIRVTAE